MVQMEGTRDGVVAIAGILCGGRRYANVGDTGAVRQLYPELPEEAGHEDPMNQA